MEKKRKSEAEKRRLKTERKTIWDNENITRIVIKPRKDEAQAIKDYAAAHGMSTQAFILSAIRSSMEKE